VDREEFDPPANRSVIDRETAERHQRELYERLKRKYEPETTGEQGATPEGGGM
jgi:hypothetical protein